MLFSGVRVVHSNISIGAWKPALWVNLHPTKQEGAEKVNTCRRKAVSISGLGKLGQALTGGEWRCWVVVSRDRKDRRT